MKKPSLVAEGTITRLLQSAEQSFKHCKYAECLEALERARRLAPANFNVHYEIGHFHVRRFDYVKATESFDRAIQLSPHRTQTMERIGVACRGYSAFELSVKYLEQAAAQKDASPEGLSALATVYERLRRMDEANALADRAIKSFPSSSTAMLIKARMDFVSGKTAEAEVRLRAFPTSREELGGRVRAAYYLGAVLDRQGRYDEAMEAFQHGKSLQQRNAPRHIEELLLVRKSLKDLRDSLRPEILQRWHEFRHELQPAHRLALLGGHPRSGTTLLEQVVDSHAEIVSAEETDIFAKDSFAQLSLNHPGSFTFLEQLESATKETLLKARANYFRQIEAFLRQPVGTRLLVDKNPSLTFLVPMLSRIFPEIKYLIVLRDPRDVVMSCFMQPVFLNQVSSAWLSLEGTVNEYIALMGGWRKTMPKLANPVLEVRYEDMVENLEPVARKTLDFLGVAWDPKVLGFDEHARQKIVRSPTYADVTKKVFKTAVGRWRNYQKYFEPHLAKLEPLAKELGYE